MRIHKAWRNHTKIATDIRPGRNFTQMNFGDSAFFNSKHPGLDKAPTALSQQQMTREDQPIASAESTDSGRPNVDDAPSENSIPHIKGRICLPIEPYRLESVPV